MSLPGLRAIAPLQAPNTPDLGLRPFQRITAQVLGVSGTTATLSIAGYPVVAQLTSVDQATVLLNQATAQFIVTKLTAEGVTLKLVKNELPSTHPAAPLPANPELAARLLEQNQLPVTANNLLLARSVLKQQLPVTPGLLTELLGALSESGNWGATEADLAAALKAAGLPVTGASLALAARQTTQTGAALGQLITSLQAAGQNLPPELLKQLDENLQMLNALVLRWDDSPAQVAEQLKAAAQFLGQSLENILSRPDANLSEKSLLALILLQQNLEKAGNHATAQAIEKFLGDLRQQHLLNIKSGNTPGRETWFEIGWLLQGAQQKTEGNFTSARLRIAREPEAGAGKPSPALTRLILQVDLKPGETVEVDLALAGKHLYPTVTAPDPGWCEQAQNELPSLEMALQTLGFVLQEAHIAVGTPKAFDSLPLAASKPPLLTVDIEA